MLHTGAVLHGTRCQPKGLPAQKWYIGLGNSLWLQEWAAANVKCNHIALICFPTALFLYNSACKQCQAHGLHGALGRYLQKWPSHPRSDHHPECAPGNPVRTVRDLESNHYIPVILLLAILPSCSASLKSLGDGRDGLWGDDVNINFFFFFF